MTRTKRFIMMVLLAIMITLSTSKGVQAAGATSPILKADGTNLKYRGTNTNVMGLTNYEYKTSDFRAVWVGTVSNLDVGKLQSNDQAGIDAYKAELTAIIDNMKLWGMNAMIFQIRPMNDAFYDSSLNHWSSYFYNGQNPEWDMLSWLIDECHKNGIEFQAWLNPYRVTGSGVTSLADYAKTISDKNAQYGKNNLAADPSTMLLNSSNGAIYNPGDPRVRQFLINTIKEIVEKYDVDGIHFDDYFYATLKDDTSDNATMQQYPVSGINNKADWRREQVTIFIRELSTYLKNFNLANNRAVQLGISPTGIWANKSSNSLGSNTAGFEHYGPYLYCDTRKWVKENIIDYILPQTYWGLEHTAAPFADLAQWWATTVRGTQVNLYLGNGIYMEAENRADWVNKPNEIDNQLKVMGVYPEIKGYSFFRYGFVRDVTPARVSGYNGVNLIKNDYWKKAVPGPALQRYPNMVSAAPSGLRLSENTLSWQAVAGARGYNVYKIAKGSTLDITNPNNLYTYTASNSISVDTASADYYVASVSKANNLSNAVKLTYALGDANSVINAINGLPDPVTFNDQATITKIRASYNALNASDKALVTNYSKLLTAEAQLVKIMDLKEAASTIVTNIPKQLTYNYTLPTFNSIGATITWRYAEGQDQSLYDIAGGTLLVHKVVTSLRDLEIVVQKDGLTYVEKVTFNFGLLAEGKTGLYYYNTPSSISNEEPGTPSTFVGFSGYTLEINNNVLFIANGNYIELTDTNISASRWGSCAIVYKNVSDGNLTFTVGTTSINSTPTGYGYMIIGTDGLVKLTDIAYTATTSITLLPNEYLYAPKFNDGNITGSPLKPVTNFNVGQKVIITNVNPVPVSVTEVIDAINLIPANVTLADETAINAARFKYSALSESDKALVANYDSLVSAEAAIAHIKADQMLASRKNEALAQLGAVNLNNYSSANKVTISNIISAANVKINASATILEVDQALQEALGAIGGVKTISQEQAEQLETAKISAKANLAGYVNLEDYSEANRQTIEEIIASADARIDSASTLTQVNTIVTETEADLDEVATLEEENQAFLQEKNAAKSELDNYPVYENYSDAKKADITNLIVAGKADIDKATTIAEVQSAVASCKAAIDAVPNIEEEEQLEFADYIDSKIEELKDYVNMDRYSTENQAKVQEILDRYEPLIKNAESKTQASSLLRDAKTEINAIEKLPLPTGCSFAPAASTFLALFAALAALGYLLLRRR